MSEIFTNAYEGKTLPQLSQSTMKIINYIKNVKKWKTEK